MFATLCSSKTSGLSPDQARTCLSNLRVLRGCAVCDAGANRGCAARAVSCQRWGETEPSPAPHAPKRCRFWVQKPGASVYLWSLLFKAEIWLWKRHLSFWQRLCRRDASVQEQPLLPRWLRGHPMISSSRKGGHHLCPLPAWLRGSSGKAKAPTRSSDMEMPARLGGRLTEKKASFSSEHDVFGN